MKIIRFCALFLFALANPARTPLATGAAPAPQSAGDFLLVAHGGAGDYSRMTAEQIEARRAVMVKAIQAGYAILAGGGASLDAVEATIRVMEDSGLFDAGRGAYYTREGVPELDAAIMDGRTLGAGSVASVKRVANPIHLARLVMEKTPHVLLVGTGAKEFAKSQGIELVSPFYFYNEREWNRYKNAKSAEEKKASVLLRDKEQGTVGVVALDQAGNLAAGTSTGGTVLKMPGRVTVGPKIQTISLQYTQVEGRPEGVPYISCKADTLGCAPVTTRPEAGITSLIQQVLSQFAEQGGQAFTVRKLEMPYGPRWEVYSEQARDRSGRFVFQPDVLSANIFIPKEQRALGDMLGLICEQLTTKWGHKFGIASAPINPFSLPAGELGADNVSAWRALADLMGRTLALRLFYAPDDGMYYVNIVNLPYRPPPRPPTPAPVPATVLPPGPRPPGYWLIRARTPDGILEIQGGLAKAGYLHTAPTTQWDAEATAALRQFQAAVGFPPTGEFDYWTAWKLAAFLPQYSRVLPARGPMNTALQYWLESTQRGRTEIQQALTKAGFYSGPTTGTLFDEKTREALKAFQAANGLTPNGLFDEQTAEKLAPFLPEP